MEPALEGARPTGPAFYRSRRPQETPLYQILERYFDTFRAAYEERFEQRYGPWCFVWDDVVPKYLDCGVPQCGFARILCPRCRQGLLLTFSCKARLCPSCEQKRMLMFTEKVTGDILLAVPHWFFTFSVPKAIRGIMLRDRRLLKLLPRCA